VVRHSPDDIVGIHDGGRPSITLTKRDVLIYRIDHRRICRSAVLALGIDASEAAVDGLPHTFRIGSYRPFAGLAFPAYLTIPLESADLLRAAEVVSSQSEVPFIIIAPTSRRLRPASEALLKQRNACFLTLAESIITDSAGKWTATPEAAQRLAAFQQAVVPQAMEAGAMAFFPTPSNATWTNLRIKFIDGETVSLKLGDVAGTFVYSQMGMADGRNAKPTKQWELLRFFARGFGVMTWNSPDANRKNQKRRESLADDLKSFFRLDGEPIVLTDDKKGWRTAFSIEPDA
jgi:hypothetical protein